MLSAAALAAAAPAFAAYHSLEEIPVESVVYRLIDDLASTYRVSHALLQTRPWTRAELGVFLDELVADTPAAGKDPAVVRLRRELEPEGGASGLEPMISAEEDDHSLELSPYMRVSFAQDEARGTITRDFRAGGQYSHAFGTHALLFTDVYMGTITPGAHGTPDENGSFRGSSTKTTLWLDRGYAVYASKSFTLRAGRTWLRWGPGAEGTLALSDGAPAFDLIQASTRIPGGSRFTWFLASLDPVHETYLAGHRLDLRAGPSVEMGVSGLVRFDGTANAPLYFLPVVPLTTYERRVRAGRGGEPDSLTRTNLLASADLSWTWRPGIRLYGEVAVDDATRHGQRPLAMAWQGGMHLRRRIGDGVWTARVEYSRVYPFTYSVAHRHDFVHEGFATGYPLGPDVDRWYGKLEWRPDASWAFGIEASDVRKGRGQLGQPWIPGTPVPGRELGFPGEQDVRYAFSADLAPSPSFALGASIGTAKIDGLGRVTGNDTDGLFGAGRLTLRW